MKNYRHATSKLCDFFEDLIVDGEIKIPSYTFADAIARGFPGLEWQTDGTFGSRYIVAPPVALMLIKLARSDYRFYDLCVEICVCNIDSQSTLPDALSYFTIEVLKGKWLRPRNRGRERKKTWLRDAFLFSQVRSTMRVFNLPATRNDVSAQVSACDAVAEALTICGRKTTYDFVKGLWTHADKKTFREEMDLVERFREDTNVSVSAYEWMQPEAVHLLADIVLSIEQGIRSIPHTRKR